MATGYTGTVSLVSSDPLAVLPSGYTFTAADAGSHGFAVELDTAGTQSITATDTANTNLTGSRDGNHRQGDPAGDLELSGADCLRHAAGHRGARRHGQCARHLQL